MAPEPTIAHGAHVAVTFTIEDADSGQQLDATHAAQPLHYTQGARQMLRSFERRVFGLRAGDTFDFTLSVDDAYGPRSEQVLQKVRVDTLPPGLKPGMVISLGIPGFDDLPPVVFHVTDIRGDIAHLDGNHPLAGRALRFRGAILKVLQGDV